MNRTIRRALLLIAAFALFVVPAAAIAAAGFTDVADDSVFVADIQWMKDNAITAGCNPPANDRYCPGNNVTREQMSAFMRRLATYQVVDAATAIEADHATSADTATDSDTVDGIEAAALMTSANMVRATGYTNLPAAATTEVVSLSLEPGSYLVLANGLINNNAGTTMRATCTLTVGTVSAVAGGYELAALSGPGDREGWSLMLATTVGATTDATITCTTEAGFSGNIGEAELAAISLQSASMTPMTASGSAGDGEG